MVVKEPEFMTLIWQQAHFLYHKLPILLTSFPFRKKSHDVCYFRRFVDIQSKCLSQNCSDLFPENTKYESYQCYKGGNFVLFVEVISITAQLFSIVLSLLPTCFIPLPSNSGRDKFLFTFVSYL